MSWAQIKTPIKKFTLAQKRNFTAAASLALFDYLRKSRAQGYVLSLSGGADSSSIAVLVAEAIRRAVEALGVAGCIACLNFPKGEKQPTTVKEIIFAILFTAYQSTENSSESTYQSAKGLGRINRCRIYRLANRWYSGSNESNHREGY